MKKHKINIKLIKLYVSTILKLPNTQLSHEKEHKAYDLLLYWLFFNFHREPVFQFSTYHYAGLLSSPKKQPKQPVSCSFAQPSSTIQIQVFHPFNRPTWKKLATQRLQENTYRTWIFLFRRNPSEYKMWKYI